MSRIFYYCYERRINCFHISLLQCETLLMFPVSAFYKEIKAQCVAYRIPSYPFCYYHKPIRKNKKIFEEHFHLCTLHVKVQISFKSFVDMIVASLLSICKAM